ncbi:MAG: DUF4855 domain-containing protein [Thermaerobacter sp.]|nr:DUF4855 domain-containing protein [Thermaerobacter sp.]
MRLGTLAASGLAAAAIAIVPLSGAFAEAGPAAPVDLALGKPYTVTSPIVDPQLATSQQNWPDSGYQLTNGNLATPGLNHGWVGYLSQDSRTITVNLGQVDTISSLSARFLQGAQWGIYGPERVLFDVSTNGQKWQRVADVTNPTPQSSSTVAAETIATGPLHVAAQYVRIQFPVDIWTFVNQIDAMGVPGVAAGTAAGEGNNAQISPNMGYAGYDRSGGAHHILLTYLLDPASVNPSVYPWILSPSQWLPQIAYLNSAGQIQNWYFKTILALPDYPLNSQSTWQGWLNDLFNQGSWNTPSNPTQLTALNQAVGQAKQALHDPSYRENVILAIPYPKAQVSNWGTLGGQTMNFATTADRIAAVQWFIQQAMQDWNASHYTNLHLAGFYWYNESIDLAVAGEKTLVKTTAATVHALGRRFYWIPYFEAPGYKMWRQLGFDVAMMQPNFAFQSLTNPVRLTETAQLAQHYGMGLELEFPYQVLNPVPASSSALSGTNRYLLYQDAALAYGYAKGVPLAWYQNTQNLLLDYQGHRYVYDLLYQFLQGTYTPTAYVDQNGTYIAQPTHPSLPPFTPLALPRGLNGTHGIDQGGFSAGFVRSRR